MKFFVLATAIFLTAVTSRAALAVRCEHLFLPDKIIYSSADGGASKSFKKWNFRKFPSIKASQFLPKDFLEQIGPMSVEVYNITVPTTPFEKFMDSVTSRDVDRKHYGKGFPKGRVGYKIIFRDLLFKFVEVTISVDPTKPYSVEISELQLINPIASQSSFALHDSQHRKGMPISVFNHLKRQFFKFLQYGDFSRITSEGAQNYLVSLLYRRMIGMKPATLESEKFYQYADYLYDLTRRGPEILRTQNVNDFTKWIGSIKPISKEFEQAEAVWMTAYKDGKIPETMEAIYDQGKLVALVEKNSSDRKIYFIDPNLPNRFFHWRRYVNHSELTMSLDAGSS